MRGKDVPPLARRMFAVLAVSREWREAYQEANRLNSDTCRLRAAESRLELCVRELDADLDEPGVA